MHILLPKKRTQTKSRINFAHVWAFDSLIHLYKVSRFILMIVYKSYTLYTLYMN